ncbi:MAG: Crp/Fnr family transcriptional regulator [Desulfobacterales bacterium]|nr:Crp/Fnr family transcriptional regulator [Desulfobacterales bacterium]
MPSYHLIQHLESYIPLQEREKFLLKERFSIDQIKRKQKILSEGMICKHYTFITEGCFRLYGVDDKGYEHNIQFAAENDWIADIGSFHTRRPSRLNIQAIEDSVIIQIEQQDLYFLYLNIPKLDRIFKVIIENKYVELQNRVLQNFSSTAELRYLSFLEQYPTLTHRLPNTHIASYLGITPEFLSKIRKDLSKKK